MLTNPFYHLIAAAIFGEAGTAEDIEAEREWLLEHAPGDPNREYAYRPAQGLLDTKVGAFTHRFSATKQRTKAG